MQPNVAQWGKGLPASMSGIRQEAGEGEPCFIEEAVMLDASLEARAAARQAAQIESDLRRTGIDLPRMRELILEGQSKLSVFGTTARQLFQSRRSSVHGACTDIMNALSRAVPDMCLVLRKSGIPAAIEPADVQILARAPGKACSKALGRLDAAALERGSNPARSPTLKAMADRPEVIIESARLVLAAKIQEVGGNWNEAKQAYELLRASRSPDVDAADAARLLNGGLKLVQGFRSGNRGTNESAIAGVRYWLAGYRPGHEIGPRELGRERG